MPSGYVPGIGERDPDRLTRAIRNLYELLTAEPLTEETSPDPSADWLLLVDVSAGEVRKVHPSLVGGGRQILAADRTYYVRTDGSDSNTGLANTAGGAFLTIQRAIDVVAALDLSIYDVTIQLGAGTYAAANALKPLVGAGTVTIVGDEATPGNVHVQVSGGTHAFKAVGAGGWVLAGMKLSSSTGNGPLLWVTARSHVTFRALEFGAATHHLLCEYASLAQCTGNYSISGGGFAHVRARDAAVAEIQSVTVTVSGTPNFTGAYAVAERIGLFRASSCTFSGSATGKRYDLNANGVIYTNGAGATYFPGNAAGTTATGGQYV